MNKQFVPYKEASALKELGFNEKCLGYYGIQNELKIEISSNLDTNLTRRDFYAAPTYSQAFRWFRKKCKYHHYIEPIYRDGKVYYEYCVVNYLEDEKNFNEENIASTYEEAELECLRKLIEIVKIK